jgi:uncharacterized protein YjbI with pentapeptide repeats
MKELDPNLFLINSDEPAEPFTPGAQDYLGYQEYAVALKEVAINCETPATIGIHGRWGTGKTSLMRIIEQLLQQYEKQNVRTVWFNPWMYQFDESPMVPLLHEIRNLEFITGEKIKRKGKQLIEKLIGSITFETALKASITGAALTGVVPPFLAPLFSALTQKKKEDEDPTLSIDSSLKLASDVSDKYFESKTPTQFFVDNFEKAIATVVGEKGRLVVFIDDLDRCMPEQLIKVLESLKLFLNARNCVYFVAIDRDIVAKSISHLYKNKEISGADYLEKIIQLPFDIPPIRGVKLEDYIKSLTKDKMLDKYLPILVEGIIRNPRQVKRFINTFKLRDILGQKSYMIKYDKRILAKVLVIQFSFPELYKRICDDATIFLFLQRCVFTAKQKNEKWDQVSASYLKNNEIETYIENSRLRKILSFEPKIENTGILYEYIHLTRTFAPSSPDEKMNPAMLDFRSTDLSRAQLQGKDFTGYNFNGTSFREADLSKSWFEGANLSSTNLRKTKLINVDFSNADLTGADFRESFIENAKFFKAKIDEANFKDAKIDRTSLNNLRSASGYKWDEDKFEIKHLEILFQK